jgi:hypothetical protein
MSSGIMESADLGGGDCDPFTCSVTLYLVALGTVCFHTPIEDGTYYDMALLGAAGWLAVS